MATPHVCIVGANGLIGSSVTPVFVSALHEKDIASLTVLTRSLNSNIAAELKSQGVNIALADFSSKDLLAKTLKGCDILISCIGTQGDYQKSKDVLVEAAAEAGVKIYIMSEYGTDHRSLDFKHPMFENKQHHHTKAVELGLKPVAIYIGLIMEIVFTPRLGFDSAGKTWTIVGDGTQKLALTSKRDLGPVTLQAALLAYRDPENTPSNMRIFSDNRTLLEYKSVFESSSGDHLELKQIPFQQAQKQYEETKDSIPPHLLGPLIPLLTADGSFNHESDNVRDLLNPKEKHFKWTRIEEYSEEVGGRP